ASFAPLKLAFFRLEERIEALERSALLKSAAAKVRPVMVRELRSQPGHLPVLSAVSLAAACDSVASTSHGPLPPRGPVGVASVCTASCMDCARVMPVKSAPVRLARMKTVHWKDAPAKLALVRSAPEKSADFSAVFDRSAPASLAEAKRRPARFA